MTEVRQLNLFKGKRQKGEKAPTATEFEMQCVIADSLVLGISPGWMWTAFPAGELRTEATGAKLKRMGLKKGFPDLLFIDPDGRHLWMELKRGNAPLSEEQSAIALKMIARNIPHVVARSVPQAISILRDWGAIQIKLADQLAPRKI